MAASKVKPLMPNAPQMTLADVLSILVQHPDIPSDRLRNAVSSIRALCRILGDEPGRVLAAPASLRPRIEAIHWQQTGLSRRYLASLKTNTLMALHYAGVPVMQSRATAPLSAEWQNLKSAIPDKGTWCHLSRFAAYCTARRIKPQDVGPEVFAQFEAELDTWSLKGDPAVTVRHAAWAWGKAAAFVPGGAAAQPRAEKKVRRYALDWEDFPSSFFADVEAFTAARSDSDPFAEDYCRPVADSTAALRRQQIRRLGSALVASGFPVESLTSLSVLTSQKNAEAALQHLYDRAGSRITATIGQLATLLKTIAKYHVKAPEPTIRRLTELTANLRLKKVGLVAKNKDRLRQFDQKENIDLLLKLPPRVLVELSRKADLGANDVARGVYAIAVELLLRAPIRLTGLCHLRIGSELLMMERNGSRAMRMVLSKTKNGEPYEAILSAEVAAWVDLYMRTIRPALAPEASPWLFPNQQGGPRSPTGFSIGLKKFIARETGLVMNPHLFRHFAVLMHQRTNPGDRETPRSVLGHKAGSRTMEASYTLADTAAAARRHDALITDLRSRPAASAKRTLQGSK